MLENELVLNLLFNPANVDSVAAPCKYGELDKPTGTAISSCTSICKTCTKLPRQDSTATQRHVLAINRGLTELPVVCKADVLASVVM